MVQQRGNRQLLGEWLSRSHLVTVGESENDLDQAFDLAVFDTSTLARLRHKVQQRQSAELPAYLPFLLITSRQDTHALPIDLSSMVDELIVAPIEPVELRARVEVLLRVRKDSLDLKRHNDELEVFISELTGAFEVAEDVTQLTEILLDRTLKLCGCDSGGIVILEGKEPLLANVRGDALPGLQEASTLASIMERAVESRKRALPSLSATTTDGDQVVMPILVKNEVAGAVILSGGSGNRDESSERLLQSMCALAGVFLHNLRQAHRLVDAAQVYLQLDQAETVQRQLLPVSSSSVEGLETAAAYQATNSVGGDYYDVIDIDDRHVAAVIADVAGHSLSSGLVMTAARSAFRVILQREKRPGEVMEQLNRALYPDLDQTGIFISMCLLVVDLESMTASYANAGHCAPMVFRQCQETPISLEATGIPLGILAEPGFSEEQISLRDGDVVVLYTDGITEARNSEGQFWEEEGLSQCVINLADRAPESVAQALVDGALKHSNSHLTDDLTVLVLGVKAKGQN